MRNWSMRSFYWLLVVAIILVAPDHSAFAQVGASIQPKLNVRPLGTGKAEIYWSSSITNFALHVADRLSPAAQWMSLGIAPEIRGDERVVIIQQLLGTRFYRLQSTSSPNQLPPTVSSFFPTSGVLGTEVILQGTGFDPDSARRHLEAALTEHRKGPAWTRVRAGPSTELSYFLSSASCPYSAFS